MAWKIILAAGAVVALNAGTAIGAAPATQIEGPITGGKRGFPYSASIVDLKPYGYTESEYFISGRAHPFAPAPGTTLSADGRWQVVPGEDVPYKTRILVRKPPTERFNGTVIVEFMQEYFGTERDTNFRWNAEAILREGFGWVGASLHHEGIDDPTPPQTFNYGGISFTTGTTLARWDPERYGTLSVPSTDLSYDILTQIGRAVGPRRTQGGIDPFAGLKIKKVLAVGNTIAGHRLAIYLNGVQPIERVFDGFFLQDLTPNKLQLAKGVPTPTAPPLRTDVDVPVLVLETTTAVVDTSAPQPEGPKIRVWEPAGSSHTNGPATARIAEANKRDLGVGGGFCPADYANTFPVQYVSSAALVALDKWVKGGAPAPTFPRMEVIQEGKGQVTRFDQYGNSEGGLRTPWVDVPVARYDWRGECPGGSGRTYPFAAEQLRALYGTPATYLQKFTESVRSAEKRGVLLHEDAETAIRDAAAVKW